MLASLLAIFSDVHDFLAMENSLLREEVFSGAAECVRVGAGAGSLSLLRLVTELRFSLRRFPAA